ncbi:MAG: DUF6941 family protein [Actinomycetota bacterium]
MKRVPRDWIVTALLCDSAQVAGSKLFVLGGGWSLCGPGPFVHALAIKLGVPWDQANRQHTLKAELLDEDGEKLQLGDPPSDFGFETTFQVGRPPGLPPGTHLDVPLAVNLGPLEFPPNKGYAWALRVDGEELERITFRTRPASS